MQSLFGLQYTSLAFPGGFNPASRTSDTHSLSKPTPPLPKISPAKNLLYHDGHTFTVRGNALKPKALKGTEAKNDRQTKNDVYSERKVQARDSLFRKLCTHILIPNRNKCDYIYGRAA